MFKVKSFLSLRRLAINKNLPKLERIFLTLFLVFSLPIQALELKYNYRPGENNLQTIKNPDELESVIQHLEAVESFKRTKTGFYINLKPILLELQLKHLSPIVAFQLKRRLGLEPLFRYSEKTLFDVGNVITFFLKNQGYLDTSTTVRLFISKEGFAKVKVDVDTGPIFLYGGFEFINACFKPSEFYRKFNKPFGIPFSYLLAYEGLDKAFELCRKKGYLYSVVYLEEPFDVKRESLYSFFWKNLKTQPGLVINFLSHYTDLLLTNPIEAIKFIYRPQYAVYPKLVFLRKESQKITYAIGGIENHFKKQIEELIKKNPRLVYNLARLKEEIKKLLADEGYFDAKVSLKLEKKNLLIEVSRGERYRLVLEIVPKLKGLPKVELKYYSAQKVEEYLKNLRRWLIAHNYLFAEIKNQQKLEPKTKTVHLKVEIKNARTYQIEVIKKIEVPDKGLKKNILQILSKVRTKEIITNPQKKKELEQHLETFLKAAQCESPTVSVKVEKEKTTAKVVYKISCPKRRKIGKLLYWIEGKLPKRELDYIMPFSVEGKTFSQKWVELVREKLLKENLFYNFTVKPIKVKKDKVDLLVEGNQRRPFSLSGGVGFSTDEGLFLQTRFQIINLLNTGEIFSLDYSLSGRRNTYNLGYFDNHLFSKTLFGGANLFKSYEEHTQYDITSKGYSLILGLHRGFYSDFSLTLVSSENNYTFDGTENNLTLGKVIFDYTYRKPIFEGELKRGAVFNNIRLTRGIKGKNFYKWTFTHHIHRQWESFIGALNLSFGQASKQTPVFERFYLGGMKNLKGYSFESVAPYGGGTVSWYFNLEGGFKVYKSFYLFPGFDIGNCALSWKESFKQPKKDIYVGLGTLTGVGPIRFTVAVPLKNRIQLQDIKYFLYIGFGF